MCLFSPPIPHGAKPLDPNLPPLRVRMHRTPRRPRAYLPRRHGQHPTDRPQPPRPLLHGQTVIRRRRRHRPVIVPALRAAIAGAAFGAARGVFVSLAAREVALAEGGVMGGSAIGGGFDPIFVFVVFVVVGVLTVVLLGSEAAGGQAAAVATHTHAFL